MNNSTSEQPIKVGDSVYFSCDDSASDISTGTVEQLCQKDVGIIFNKYVPACIVSHTLMDRDTGNSRVCRHLVSVSEAVKVTNETPNE